MAMAHETTIALASPSLELAGETAETPETRTDRYHDRRDSERSRPGDTVSVTVALRLQDVRTAESIQFAAAHAREAQIRLVAGPGTGKSQTIEERIRWLLAEGTNPAEIAVV